MNSPRLALLFLAMALMVPSLLAQLSITSLSNAGDVYTYSQHFNSLPVQSTTNPTPADSWSQADVTAKLPGWFFALGSSSGANAPFNAFTGDGVQSSATIPSVRNYGGTDSSDRALGLYVGTSSTQASGAMGIVFVNDTGGTVTSFSLSYLGEEWRRGTTGKLDFSYQIVSSFDAETFNIRTSTGWIDVDTLDFNAPVLGTGLGLNGNLSDNRTSISGAVNFETAMSPGDYLLVRWHNQAIAGLAVDNVVLSMTVVPAPVPEPSTYAAIFGVLALGVVMGRRRLRR